MTERHPFMTSLQDGVTADAPACAATSEARRAIRYGFAGRDPYVCVLAVHERIGAGLEFGEQAHPGVDGEAAGAAAGGER